MVSIREMISCTDLIWFQIKEPLWDPSISSYLQSVVPTNWYEHSNKVSASMFFNSSRPRCYTVTIFGTLYCFPAPDSWGSDTVLTLQTKLKHMRSHLTNWHPIYPDYILLEDSRQCAANVENWLYSVIQITTFNLSVSHTWE